MKLLKVFLSIIVVLLSTGGVVLILADHTIGEFDLMNFILIKIGGFALLFMGYAVYKLANIEI
jgi:hypothetical protein